MSISKNLISHTNAPCWACYCGSASLQNGCGFHAMSLQHPIPHLLYPEDIAMQIHDLIGIGFGPSNIALAITLEEKKQEGYYIDSFFIEKQPSFAWHANMMLENAHMQISF